MATTWTDEVTATLAEGTGRGATGAVALPGATTVAFAYPPAAGGPTDAPRASPDQLLASAAAACWLLAFALAAERMKLDVVSSRAEASVTVVPDGPGLRIARIDVRPDVVLRGRGAAVEARARRACEVASRTCVVEKALRPGVQSYVVDPRLAFVADP